MEESDPKISQLYKKLPRREKEIDALLRLFGEKAQLACPCIFLYGHSSTGKSATIASLLEALELPHAFVNCTECYTQRILFDLILNGVSKTTPSPENNYSSFANCDNINDFVRYLKAAIETRGTTEETTYIVLDNAERLRNMSSNILPVFTRLQELTKVNICVILISEIVWEKFRVNPGIRDPFMVHFPEYSKDDLHEILSRDCPAKYTPQLFKNYVQLVLSVFYLVCRNLSELRYLANQNFPKYVEPITKGDASESDLQKLWKNIEPQLKKSLHNVYLRQSIVNTSETSVESHAPIRRNELELPFYSKYILIAAYLASYNPSKMDRQFFVKKHERVNKRAKLSAAKRKTKEVVLSLFMLYHSVLGYIFMSPSLLNMVQLTQAQGVVWFAFLVSRTLALTGFAHEVSNHLLGPKLFPLDRLLAIFHSIVEDKVTETTAIFSQITSLVSLNLLARIGPEECLDSPKFKCLVSYDFICAIARTVGFDISRYLYDFM